MDDLVFLEHPQLTVTRTRLQIGERMYPVNGITLVTTTTENPKRGGAIAMIVVGIMVAIGGIEGGVVVVAVGFIGAMLGVAWYMLLQSTIHLMLTTAAGEKPVWSTQDKALAGRVLRAINEAVAARG